MLNFCKSIVLFLCKAVVLAVVVMSRSTEEAVMIQLRDGKVGNGKKCSKGNIPTLNRQNRKVICRPQFNNIIASSIHIILFISRDPKML